MNPIPPKFWSIATAEMLQKLGTSKEGLNGDDARQRLARFGANLLKASKRSDRAVPARSLGCHHHGLTLFVFVVHRPRANLVVT
jgi:hypothetical protein